MTRTKKLTTCALLTALSTVLMWVSKMIPSPWLQGGSVTLASMVPVILAGILFGTRWGLCTSMTYAFIQMLFGFYPPPTQTFLSFVLVVLIDYVFAFGVLGLSGFFLRITGGRKISVPISAFIVTGIRYVCHIISGVLIWGVYAEEGQSVLLYSIVYNGSYMIPEIIISTLVCTMLCKADVLKRL